MSEEVKPVKKSSIRVREWRKKQKLKEICQVSNYGFYKMVESKLDNLKENRKILGYSHAVGYLVGDIVEIFMVNNKLVFNIDSMEDRIRLYELIKQLRGEIK
ncbi:MAG: hypothetical protein ACPLKS_07685 [Caldisericum exile]|uniref:hypothetical protein n=1 Tax=Caldisericum exile TaxID=693075 RepID=UPI003C750DA4